MGKLRTSLDNVSKTAATLEQAVQTLLDSREKEINNFMHATDLCRGGADVIYMYLMEKYKKDGKKIDQQQADTIKDVLDAKLGTLLKGVVEARAQVVKLIEQRDKTMKVGGAVKASATKLRAELAEIQRVIDKKKSKWLASAKYKSKLKGYEDAVSGLDASLQAVEKAMPGRNYGSYVNADAWKFGAATTVADIKSATSTYFSQDLKLTKAEDDEHAKKFRGRGFGNSLAMLRKWMDEADDMEADSEAPPEPKVDPKPALTGILIRKGSQEIAKCAGGTYDRASKLLSIPVAVWKIKGDNPLGHLQQKFTVTASYEDKAQGSFVADMKLTKVNGDLKKIELKGV